MEALWRQGRQLEHLIRRHVRHSRMITSRSQGRQLLLLEMRHAYAAFVHLSTVEDQFHLHPAIEHGPPMQLNPANGRPALARHVVERRVQDHRMPRLRVERDLVLQKTNLSERSARHRVRL